MTNIVQGTDTIGIATFRRDGETVWWLLLNKSGDYWNFPKGRAEAGETEQQTAIRELAEESGIGQVRLFDGFRYAYDYSFDAVAADGTPERVQRQAIFFLGEVTQADVTISDEHVGFVWLTYDEAMARIQEQPTRDLLAAASNFLLERRGDVV